MRNLNATITINFENKTISIYHRQINKTALTFSLDSVYADEDNLGATYSLIVHFGTITLQKYYRGLDVSVASFETADTDLNDENLQILKKALNKEYNWKFKVSK